MDAEDALAKTMRVLYDEGGPSPVPYLGLVVYVEPSRVYVVFDGFDEAEGAWVDDSDDWTWSDDPEAKVPVPAAAPPAWSEGRPAGLVDKIYLHRSNEEGQLSFFVKWKEAAHLHSQWVPSVALEAEPANKQRMQRYLKALAAAEAAGGVVPTWELNKEGEENDAPGAATEDEPFNPEFNIVDRVIAERPQADDLLRSDPNLALTLTVTVNPSPSPSPSPSPTRRTTCLRSSWSSGARCRTGTRA